jgi:hypothetical protein
MLPPDRLAVHEDHVRVAKPAPVSTVSLSSGCAASRKPLADAAQPCCIRWWKRQGSCHGCRCAKLGPGSHCMSCGLGRTSSFFEGDRRRWRSRPEGFGADLDHLCVGRAVERPRSAPVCSAVRRCGAATHASPKPPSMTCSTHPAGQIEHPSPGQTVHRATARICAEPLGTATHSTGRGAMTKDLAAPVRALQWIRPAHDLHPHRIRSFRPSNDPELVTELDGIVALYVRHRRTHSGSRLNRRPRLRCLTPASTACRSSLVGVPVGA